jgi:putative copper resistance protein D
MGLSIDRFRVTAFMSGWSIASFSRRALLPTALLVVLIVAPAVAQYYAFVPESPHAVGHNGHHNDSMIETWEGSARGIAYSERNHHFAGLMVVLMGLAEISHAMRLPSLRWARLLLPSSMLFAGLFVMIWSDHDAWPIGPLSFAETFSGQDYEILQHKIYGILALGVGSVELVRRLGGVGHKAWSSPLPLMAIVGGLMLFGHSHGFHPSAHKIAVHHAIMGTMAVTAGSSKLFSTWLWPANTAASAKWEWLWAGLILLIGMQLLMYSE